ADQGDVVLASQLLERPDRTDRDQVLCREDRRGRVVTGEEVTHDVSRHIHVSDVEKDEPRVEADSAGAHRLEVAEMALGRGPDPGRVTDERDPAMAVRGEVTDGRPGSAAVVGGDDVRVGDGGDP